MSALEHMPALEHISLQFKFGICYCMTIYFPVLCTCLTCAALCLALAYTSFNNLIYNTYNFKRTPAMPDVYILVAPVWSHRQGIWDDVS